MTPFTTTLQETKFGRSINYKVHGYWSNDIVRCDQYLFFSTGKWDEPEVNWGIGGRDSKEEPDNLVAAECFAKAILDAVEQAKKWKP